MALLQQLGESVTSWRYCARMPTKFGGTTRSPNIIEGRLQVGLLAKGIGTRSRQDLLWAEGRKASSEPLKRVAVRTLFGWRLGFGGLQQRRPRDDTGVADEAGIPAISVRRCPPSCDRTGNALRTRNARPTVPTLHVADGTQPERLTLTFYPRSLYST